MSRYAVEGRVTRIERTPKRRKSGAVERFAVRVDSAWDPEERPVSRPCEPHFRIDHRGTMEFILHHDYEIWVGVPVRVEFHPTATEPIAAVHVETLEPVEPWAG